ncbi:MAG TPA: bacteriohopanetetrol glucosamine biosynthesis glycosyltransferase HpnI [Acetobacteraceae bacterium]|nr:bacteriohopanetetrol glucosamine biosynthesis glycosyltransferase HpnI [Acetobacteraceae bacterium]
MTLLAYLAATIGCVGLLLAFAGWAVTHRFARRHPPALLARPPVSVLRPLHGNEPLLEEALASVCAQDYPTFQVVFGVQNPADPALDVVRRLRARFPKCDITVVVDATQHGANRKVGNLINMAAAARHDVLVIADSDVHVTRDYLDRLVAALARPGTGLVTTIYTGLPGNGGLAARLGATQITHTLLPGALLARLLGRQDCFGASMALRRATLERIGGLRALADHLADDNVLGRLVREQGLAVELATTVPATTVPETTLKALWMHELRWARTIRALEPLGFALSAVQYPLVWSALAIGFSGGETWSIGLFVLAWLVRGLAARGVDRAIGVAIAAPVWLLPLRDLMFVAVMIASFLGDRVEWRGYSLYADDGRAEPGTRAS